jgi:hypothetical protein
MEDFNALAAALGAEADGVRAGLIVSRDGLVLGAHPADAEDVAKPALLHLAQAGDPERGFLQFATETWCYVRRGPYSAFVLATAAARPGLVIDRMERVLLSAEGARSERPPERTQPVAAPTTKPRTPLHPEPMPEHPVVLDEHSSGSAPPQAPTTDDADAPPPVEEREPQGTPERSSNVWAGQGNEGDEADEVDTYTLTKELGRLLQGEGGGADG